MPLRFGTALRYFVPDIGKALAWTFNSRELANFTYDLTTQMSRILRTLSLSLLEVTFPSPNRVCAKFRPTIH